MAWLSIGEALQLLKPLSLFVLGMAVYALFVFKLYRFMGRRDIFSLDLQKYGRSAHPSLRKLCAVLLYALEHAVILPAIVLFWFGVLTVLLALMARNETLSQVMLISIAVVSAVRVTAYYDEDLSKDLAKMLPFALLGVFLIDVTYFRIDESVSKLGQISSAWTIIPYYTVFVICLEAVLRIAYACFKRGPKETVPARDGGNS